MFGFLQNKKGFFRNVSILAACNIIVVTINLFINMYLARVLHTEGYGKYGIIFSVSNILLTISSLGIRQVTMRRISQDQKNSLRQFKVSIIARLLGYVCVLIPFIVYNCYWGGDSFFIVVMTILYVFCLTIWDCIQNVAFAMQRMEYTGYISAIGAIILLIIYTSIPKQWISIYTVVLILITITFAKNILYYFKCKQQNLFTSENNLTIAIADIKGVIKESFPFYILAVLTLCSTDWPVVFLDIHSGVTEVAYYSSANKILKPAALVMTTIMSALLPNLSREFVTNKERFAEKVNSMFKSLIVLGTTFCFIISIFRDEIVYVVFGEEYQNTGNVLLAQCWYVVFHALFALFGNALSAMKKEKLVALLAFVYAIVSLCIFLPTSYYGATALSYGVILMCIINITYHIYFFKRNLGDFLNYFSIFRLMSFMISIMIVSIYIVQDLSITTKVFILLALIFSIIIYHKRIFRLISVRPNEAK